MGDPIALTGASALATQPYAAALFSQLPLLSPLANLVASPLFALACLVGFVAVLAACLVPVAAPWLIGVASTACAPLSLVVDALASLSGTCLPIDAVPLAAAALSCGLCLALWAWWPRVSIRGLTAAVTGAALILGLLRFPFGMAPDAIVMLDVGQGDAFIVRSGENVLLIDTGNQDALLKAALARQRVGRLDAVAVTHSDDDHCGSLPVLGDVAPAAALLVPEGLPACGCRACAELMEAAEAEGLADDLVELSLGDTVRCGRFSLTVLWPERLADDGGNADSLCLLAFWDGDGDGAAEWTALFTGDAEAEQLGQLSDRLPAGGVDVLKVGHHGSKKSLDASLAERLSPAVALIGVGEHNRYGHPSQEVLDLLDASGCATYCSNEAGDVVVAFSEDTLTVSAQRQGYNGVMSDSQHTDLLPAYLAVGEDALKREAVIARLKARLGTMGDMAFNSDEFDGESAEGAAIAAACNTMPFASPVRLVYVRNVDKLKKADAEELVNYLKAPSATTVLACEAEKLARNTRLYKALAAAGPKAVIDCAPPKSWELPKRVRAMACTHGITLTEGAASALVELVGENTVHLDNELKKIALAHGTGEGVGEREVRALVARTSEVKPWDFTAAFAERNLGKCLALRSKMESTSPHVLIALCTTRLRELMAAQSMARRGNPRGLAKALGAPDWRVKNHGAWARQWRPEELRRALASSRDAEQAMKSGSDPDEVFYRWLVETLKR